MYSNFGREIFLLSYGISQMKHYIIVSDVMTCFGQLIILMRIIKFDTKTGGCMTPENLK